MFCPSSWEFFHWSNLEKFGSPKSVQSLSCVRLFVTPWTAARQASLSFSISRSLLKLMSIKSVMPSNHLILCHPFSPPAFNLSQHQRLCQWLSSLHQVAKDWRLSFSFSISPSNEYWGLISFRMDWSDLLAVQGTLRLLESSLTPQFKSINFLALSCLYSPTLTSIHDYWKKP